jgi:hypothetical protein
MQGAWLTLTYRNIRFGGTIITLVDRESAAGINKTPHLMSPCWPCNNQLPLSHTVHLRALFSSHAAALSLFNQICTHIVEHCNAANVLHVQVHEFNPFLRRCNPDVCHSYALSAFRVHSNSHQDSSPCQYGSLPGVLNFNVMKPAGARWQTAVSNCQLQNLLLPSPKTGHAKVLVRRALLSDGSRCMCTQSATVIQLPQTPQQLMYVLTRDVGQVPKMSCGSNSN